MNSAPRPYAITGLIVGGLLSGFSLTLLTFGLQLPHAMANVGQGGPPPEVTQRFSQISFYCTWVGGILSATGLALFIVSFVFFLRRPRAATPPPLPGGKG